MDLCIIAHELLFLLLDLSVLTGLDHLFLVYYVRMILLRDLLVVNLLLLLRWCLVVVLSVHLVDVVVLHCCSASLSVNLLIVHLVLNRLILLEIMLECAWLVH